MDFSDNNCFVCGPKNSSGLKINFSINEQDICIAEFTPEADHVGFQDTTHGGIIFSLLDDVMANWLFLKGKPCLLYTSPSPRDATLSRMPSSA